MTRSRPLSSGLPARWRSSSPKVRLHRGWFSGAVATRARFQATRDVAAAVAASGSGVELSAGGFAGDVEIATEIDASTAVPPLTGGAFTNAGPRAEPRR